MPAPRLTLLVPQLLWPEPQDVFAFEGLNLPGLQSLLARSRCTRQPVEPWETSLAACFGLGNDAPLGALRLLGEEEAQERGNSHWLCADPVHLKFHHERVVLADASAFALSGEESSVLIAALNREFSDIGSFHAAHPQRWYLRLNAACAYQAAPLSAIAGRTLDSQLPEGGDALRFKRLLNEVQMFLHGHPVNQAREAAGQPPVNSVWLWGNGQAGKLEAEISGVWSSHPLAIGLARAARLPQHPQAIDLGNVLAHAAPESQHLVVLDSLLAPALYDDSATWRTTLQELEERWFAPLARRSLPLTLLAPTAYGRLQWQSQPLDRWKFWRRPQALGTLARSFVESHPA